MYGRPVRQRPPQQRYFRPPKGCPTAQCFDMNNGLEEQPLQKSKARLVENSRLIPQDDADEGPDYFLSLPLEQYQARIWNELHEIEEEANQRCSDETQPVSNSNPQELDCSLEPEPEFKPHEDYGDSSYPFNQDLDWMNKRGGFEHNESPEWSGLSSSYQACYPAVEEQATPAAIPIAISDRFQTESRLLNQTATRPILEAQLIDEVKGIYAGLVMVEKKCAEIVAEQASCHKKHLENQQWKALVALHRTLLQEHHDFFSASQHPVASPALRALAVKYAMPARMWRRGVRGLLDLMQDQSPEDLGAMLEFEFAIEDWLRRLRQDVPSMMDEWNMIGASLKEYMNALRAEHVHSADTHTQTMRFSYSGLDYHQTGLPSPAEDDSDFDEVLRNSFYQQQIVNPPFSPDEAKRWYTSIALPLKNTVMMLMSGWLTYGIKIAKDFHCYCKVFKFMAWAGVSV